MTTEREKLKRAIEAMDTLVVESDNRDRVLKAAKAHLETLPEQDPLDWMEEGQMVEAWSDGWDKEHKDIRKFLSISSSGGIVVRDGFDIGDIHYDNWRLPEARAIQHNGNGQNPCPWRTVIRRYNGHNSTPIPANIVCWNEPCEFIILPEGW